MRDAQVTDLSCDVRAGFSRQAARGRKFPVKRRAAANPPSHGGLEEDDVEACASVGCIAGAN